MIAYWQLTQNGWVCSDVGDADYYTFDAAEIPALWRMTLYHINNGENIIVGVDAMRYYPA